MANLKKRLNESDHGYLLKNHGVICAAVDMEQAIANVARIESAAGVYLREHIASSGTLATALRDRLLNQLTHS